MKNVDLEKAIDNNKQLKTPSKKNSKRELFFIKLKKGKRIEGIMRKCYPKEFYKNVVKGILIKLHILIHDKY